MIRANHTKKIFSVHVGKVAWGYVAVCACDDGVAQLCLPRPSEKEALEFVTREIAPRYPRYVNERTPMIDQALKELDEYYKGLRKSFTVAVYWGPRERNEKEVVYSDFQKLVYECTMAIPYGETCAYGAIAEKTGHKGAARGVGTAMNKNPVPPIVPCHRVVAASGIGGFACGLEMKKKLFKLENIDK